MEIPNLRSKLRDYSFVAGGILLVSSEAESQIVYHNYDPVLIVYSNEFLDLNNDGVSDFYFSHHNFSSNNGGDDNSFEIYSWRTSASLAGVNDCALAVTPTELRKLNQGQLINSSLSWCQCTKLLAHQSVNYEYNLDTYSGYWFGQVNGLFGFRLKNGSEKYYGWMRMSIYTGYFAVIDYAYNSTPNQPIFAEETDLATGQLQIESQLSPKIELQNSNLLIELSHTEKQSRVFTITDMVGRKRAQLTSTETSLSIPVNELSAGEYILIIQDEKNRTTFRFLKA